LNIVVADGGGNWQNPVVTPLFLCYNTWRGKLKMSIKIALLKSGESVIADIKELFYDEKICGYLFKRPYIVDLAPNEEVLLLEEGQTPTEDRNVGVNFTPWICLTTDTEIPVRPDWIVTIVTPVEEIEKLYEEMING